MKKVLSIIMSLLMVFSLTACGGETQNEEGMTKLGAIQLAEHPALDQSYEGFIAALKDGGYVEGENLKVDFKNAQILKNINNVTMSLMLVNDNINETRKTLVDYLKSYNVIYENNQSTFTLTTSFKDTINYSENREVYYEFI